MRLIRSFVLAVGLGACVLAALHPAHAQVSIGASALMWSRHRCRFMSSPLFLRQARSSWSLSAHGLVHSGGRATAHGTRLMWGACSRGQ
jgi:hypothetical protein